MSKIPSYAPPRQSSGLAVAALALGAAAALGWWWMAPARPGVRGGGPIVLISIDTLRADRLPAYGYTGLRTPHIDRLAADGVLFEQAWAHSPQTLPSHASMLTGALPFTHGVRDNIGFTVRDGQRMLQHALGERGFRTAAFVSSFVLRRQTGIAQGFDEYDDLLPAASPEQPLGLVQRGGDDTVGAAIRWIDRQPSSTFFLFVHIYEPHTPYDPPAAFAASNAYDGEVQHADAIVGRLLDHLRGKDLYDAATIVLLSDHGEGLGDHGEQEHGIFLYRETMQVPLVIKPAAARGRAARVAAPVQHIDIAPTLIEIADRSGVRGFGGSGVRLNWAGRSLLPLLDGTGTLADTGIYAESLSPRYHFGWSELYALTDGRYRLIRAPRDELYDLAQDPGERVSLTGERPQVHAALRQALDAIVSRAPAGVTAPSAVSAEDRQRLAALGYVGTQTGAPETGDQRGARPDPKDYVHVLEGYRRATTLAGQGRWGDAARIYRELLAASPDMTDVWLQLAVAERRLGRPGAAMQAYREVITRDPKNADALTGAASALLQLGRLDEARAHAELAADVSPAAAHELLARLAMERGDAGAARQAAARAEAADPTLPMTPFIEGAILYRQGAFAAAIPHLARARQALEARTEQIPDVRYLLGDALARLERYAEAEVMLLTEVRLFPDHLRARAALAMLYRAMGRPADSERAIAELIRQAPTPEGYALAADLWAMFGEPGRAAEMRARAARRPR
ncbi:MAG TPA: sulfatase-like hydrolase/transferase [Vicinamibacterales bacterium]|nr:sulfatase-like hydrolase/transferase [Vicinamibacterales bacterium]